MWRQGPRKRLTVQQICLLRDRILSAIWKTGPTVKSSRLDWFRSEQFWKNVQMNLEHCWPLSYISCEIRVEQGKWEEKVICHPAQKGRGRGTRNSRPQFSPHVNTYTAKLIDIKIGSLCFWITESWVRNCVWITELEMLSSSVTQAPNSGQKNGKLFFCQNHTVDCRRKLQFICCGLLLEE